MSNGSTETEKYTLRELVRNNCSCCAIEKACDICDIDKQVALAVKEWLEQKKQDYLDKQDITKYQTLPETYQWIESRIKFIDELQKELSL